MALIDLINEDVVKTPLVSTTKPEVLRELADVLHRAARIDRIDPVYAGLTKREGLGSTGLANGVAVPHCKTPEVQTLTLCIGIAPHGIDFGAVDGEPSTLFFCMLAAPDQSGPHIEALAEIARLTRSKAFCRGLVSSRNAKEVVGMFRD